LFQAAYFGICSQEPKNIRISETLSNAIKQKNSSVSVICTSLETHMYLGGRFGIKEGLHGVP
jgi:hypothetical protein